MSDTIILQYIAAWIILNLELDSYSKSNSLSAGDLSKFGQDRLLLTATLTIAEDGFNWEVEHTFVVSVVLAEQE